jgi:hypothetical protein
MKTLRVLVKDKTTLMLEEDGNKGDIIDIKSLVTIDQNPIIEAIKKGTDEVYAQYFLTQSKQLKSDYDLEKAQVKEALNQKINDLKQELAGIKASLDEKIINEKNQLTMEKQKEISEKEQVIIRLQEQLKHFNTNKQLELENERTKHQSAIEKFNSEHVKKQNELQKDIDELRRERAMRNVKQIGEDLERWCLEQYRALSTFAFKTSTFEKDNEAIKAYGDAKGTKGDYIFKVFSDHEPKTLLTSAMCEMKSEELESENKKRNQDHYKKLDKDRNSKGLEYAILISELEYNTEADAPIFVVPEYKNMFVVRPYYFITLLGIIESIGIKYSELVTKRELEKIEFKTAQEILDQFEEFKNNLLNQSISNINNHTNKIKDKATRIVGDANEILKSVNIIVDTHLNTVRNKINNFNIHSLVKKIDS